MSAQIINLRRARKEKARRNKQGKAAENRALFGATRTEREQRIKDADSGARHLDGHRRDEPTDAVDAPHNKPKTDKDR